MGSVPRLLVVHHTPSPALRAMLEAALAGARDPGLSEVSVVVTPADAKLRDAHWQRLQKNQELHEVKDLERLFESLDSYSLSIDDYYLTQEESVSGEKLATKYVLINEGKSIEVAGVSQHMTAIHGVAKLRIHQGELQCQVVERAARDTAPGFEACRDLREDL